MRKPIDRIIASLALWFGLLGGIGAAPAGPDPAPESLQAWRDWLLRDAEIACVALDEGDRRACYLAGDLTLELAADRSGFALTVTVYREALVSLPGDAEGWPTGVTAEGKPVVVVDRDGRPFVRLAAGSHRLEGGLELAASRQSLRLPDRYGLIHATVDGAPLRRIEIDRGERLRIRDLSDRPGGESDVLEVRVERKLIDEMPLRLETLLRLQVGGAAREVVLGPVLPDGFRPLQLESRWPARIEPDGALRVQVRRGSEQLRLVARAPARTDRVGLPAGQGMPAREVWVVEAHPELRKIEIGGAPQLDPQQTELPPEWRTLPAYLLAPGEALELTELQRGDPTPTPNRLRLQRTAWVDFSGTGMSLEDRLQGEMHRDGRLALGAPYALGRAVVNGAPTAITALDGTPGVEVRQRALDLVAESRVALPTGWRFELPASGWQGELEQASTRLYLPPGWKALHAAGPDRVGGSWLARWTLLDLFLVGLIALAAGRLLGPAWGGLAALTLGLTYHEPLAPVWAWLHPIIATALLGYFREGRGRRVVEIYRNLSLALLGVLALLFAANQVREGIYPQLGMVSEGRAVAARPLPAALEELHEGDERAAKTLSSVAPGDRPPASAPLPVYDPDAKVQTGPGLPTWTGRALTLDWSGPVAPAQRMTLWLLGPRVSLALTFASLALAGLLFWRLVGATGWRRLRTLAHATGPGALAVLALAVPGGESFAGPPSDQQLADYRAWLTRPAPCRPHCVAVEQARIELRGERLRVRTTVHADDALLYPLPLASDGWQPLSMTVDAAASTAWLRGDDGRYRVRLEPGIHQVELIADVAGLRELELPFDDTTHNLTLAVDPDWQVRGLEAGRLVGGRLRLTRSVAAQVERLAPSQIPPFAEVQRELVLGLEWTIRTTVERPAFADAASPLTLDYPLLAGETVVSPGVQQQQGRALVTLPAGRRELAFSSRLDPRTTVTLAAAEQGLYVEHWIVRVAPVWHLVAADGPAPILTRDESGETATVWRPWPGEHLRLQLSRPDGVAGPTHTVRRVDYRLETGRAQTSHHLDLQFLSSQGARHRIALPQGARPLALSVDGQPQPVDETQAEVEIPLTPGEQLVTLEYRTPEGAGWVIASPPLELGAPYANAHLELRPGLDRWVLWLDGPLLGPAILLWGLLGLMAVLALAIARSPLSPLRSHQWLLLTLGLAPVSIVGVVIVAAWFLLVRARERVDLTRVSPALFNFTQVVLALATLAAISALLQAVQAGLLGYPDMLIAGNGSSRAALRWYQDRGDGALPVATLYSLPLWSYRVAMLGWALWLAASVVGWARWFFESYSAGGLWRAIGITLPRRGRGESGGGVKE